ncbi:MAG: hypothetical protein U9O50_04260 [Acidobacteriota bacterium]|nr:hypothetical protein [Acidobacteriota bacterium]
MLRLKEDSWTHNICSFWEQINILSNLQENEKDVLLNYFHGWEENIHSFKFSSPEVTIMSMDHFEDKTSLALIPLIVSTGVIAPKILFPEITTKNPLLQQLKVIPRISCSLSKRKYLAQLHEVGGAFYRLPRKILSLLKKSFSTLDEQELLLSNSLMMVFFSGVKNIVWHLKVGKTSFLKTHQDANNFIKSISSICSLLRVNNSFILTDGDQLSGRAFGSSLELAESIHVLKGKGPFDLIKLILELGAEMLILSQRIANKPEAMILLKNSILNGKALEKLEEIIRAQNGNHRIVKHDNMLLPEKKTIKIPSLKDGYIHHLILEKIKKLKNKLEHIDNTSGFYLLKKNGDHVHQGETLAEVLINSKIEIAWLPKNIWNCFVISKEPPGFFPLIIEKIVKMPRF